MTDLIENSEDTNVDSSDDLNLEELGELEGLIEPVLDQEVSIDIIDEKLLRQLENDGLGQYLKRIGTETLLSREQEFWYGVDVQAGKKVMQLTENNSFVPSDVLLYNLFEDMRTRWGILLSSKLRTSILGYDWGWLTSQIVTQKIEGTFSHPGDLFFLATENINFGNFGKEVARDLLELYMDFILTPLEVLSKIPWNLARHGELFSRNLITNKLHDSIIWDLDQVRERYEYAKERFVVSNLRLVISVALRYKTRGLDFDDLIQYGNLGLMRSIEKFDPCSGFRFSTYSFWWIRQAITRAIADHSRTIRIPVHLHDKIISIKWIQDKLFQKLGRPPTFDEIIEEHGDVSQKDVTFALKIIQEPLSLDDPQGGDGDLTLEDIIADPEAVPDLVGNKLLEEVIDKMLESLPARESKIIELRYGLRNHESHTLEEVGQKLGVTRERIRQIEFQALSRLRGNPKFRHFNFVDFLK